MGLLGGLERMQNNENDCIRDGLISFGDGLFYGVLWCAGF
jgi:hypothetical protein